MPKDEPEQKKLKKVSIHELIRQIDDLSLDVAPTLGHFKDMDLYFTEMREALSVINEYKDRGSSHDPQKMSQDALYLSAVHCNMGEMVGYLTGVSSRSEDSRKYARSTNALRIKKARDKSNQSGECEFIKLTEKEVDDASRVVSKEHTNAARDAEIVSRIISNTWYAIADFVKVLNTAVARANKEWSLSNGNN